MLHFYKLFYVTFQFIEVIKYIKVTDILEKYKDCFASVENSTDKEKTWKFVAFDTKY